MKKKLEHKTDKFVFLLDKKTWILHTTVLRMPPSIDYKLAQYIPLVSTPRVATFCGYDLLTRESVSIGFHSTTRWQESLSVHIGHSSYYTYTFRT